MKINAMMAMVCADALRGHYELDLAKCEA